MASLMEMKGGGPHRRFHLGSASITKFAAQLEANLDRPVIDKTQLEGLYSFTLAWDPDDMPGAFYIRGNGGAVRVEIAIQEGSDGGVDYRQGFQGSYQQLR